MIHARNVAILIFDDVEVLDFCGPFEVFSIAGNKGRDLNVFTVAANDQPVLAINHLSINPKYTLYDCPKPDILVIPGGAGTRKEMNNPTLLNWIGRVSEEAELVLSVCTGALMLAKANLLEGLKVTTHHHAFDLLREVAPQSAEIIEGIRYVDNGKIVLSAGISAGMDMSLYIVSRLFGDDRAVEVANRMEYEWSREIG